MNPFRTEVPSNQQTNGIQKRPRGRPKKVVPNNTNKTVNSNNLFAKKLKVVLNDFSEPHCSRDTGSNKSVSKNNEKKNDDYNDSEKFVRVKRRRSVYKSNMYTYSDLDSDFGDNIPELIEENITNDKQNPGSRNDSTKAQSKLDENCSSEGKHDKKEVQKSKRSKNDKDSSSDSGSDIKKRVQKLERSKHCKILTSEDETDICSEKKVRKRKRSKYIESSSSGSDSDHKQKKRKSNHGKSSSSESESDDSDVDGKIEAIVETFSKMSRLFAKSYKQLKYSKRKRDRKRKNKTGLEYKCKNCPIHFLEKTKLKIHNMKKNKKNKNMEAKEKNKKNTEETSSDESSSELKTYNSSKSDISTEINHFLEKTKLKIHNMKKNDKNKNMEAKEKNKKSTEETSSDESSSELKTCNSSKSDVSTKTNHLLEKTKLKIHNMKKNNKNMEAKEKNKKSTEETSSDESSSELKTCNSSKSDVSTKTNHLLEKTKLKIHNMKKNKRIKNMAAKENSKKNTEETSSDESSSELKTCNSSKSDVPTKTNHCKKSIQVSSTLKTRRSSEDKPITENPAETNKMQNVIILGKKIMNTVQDSSKRKIRLSCDAQPSNQIPAQSNKIQNSIPDNEQPNSRKLYKAKIYQCDDCEIPTYYLSLANLQFHLKKASHLSEVKHYCDCGLGFGSSRTLKQHQHIHHNDTVNLSREDFKIIRWTSPKVSETVKVPVSSLRKSRKYVKKMNLNRNYDMNVLYRCEKCDTHFFTENTLISHIRLCQFNKTKSRVQCDKCHLFFSKKTLMNHINIHIIDPTLKKEDFRIITKSLQKATRSESDVVSTSETNLQMQEISTANVSNEPITASEISEPCKLKFSKTVNNKWKTNIVSNNDEQRENIPESEVNLTEISSGNDSNVVLKGSTSSSSDASKINEAENLATSKKVVKPHVQKNKRSNLICFEDDPQNECDTTDIINLFNTPPVIKCAPPSVIQSSVSCRVKTEKNNTDETRESNIENHNEDSQSTVIVEELDQFREIKKEKDDKTSNTFKGLFNIKQENLPSTSKDIKETNASELEKGREVNESRDNVIPLPWLKDRTNDGGNILEDPQADDVILLSDDEEVISLIEDD